MRIAIVAVAKEGYEVGLRIKKSLPRSKLFVSKKLRQSKCAISFGARLSDLTGELFVEFDGIIFCMALGIVMRVIAPYIKNKYRDPAVVVVDDHARYAISALSGHEGHANELSVVVGNILGAEPVITTASESKKKYVIGIGCRRGIKKEEVIRAIKHASSQAKCPMTEVRCIATVDLKQKERGLKNACIEMGIPLRIISSDTIKKFNGPYQRSSFVKEKIGLEGVSEPCAILAAKKAKLILPKEKVGRATIAVAREN